jgi:SAM-dependent methyltransferase
MGANAERYVIRGGKAGYERLLLLARNRWPDTLALLQRAGLAPGMHCVDLGCGGGAVSLEIAKLVGPAGGVVGVDMDSRALLQHLRRPVDLIRRMWAGVRPGGVLIVEDADWDGWCCDPPNDGFDFMVRTCKQVLAHHGGDPASGRELHRYFLEAGIPNPQVSLVQSVHVEGDAKWLAWSTLEATSEEILASGVSGQTEVTAALSSLASFTQDPDTLISGPRIFQVWSKRLRGPRMDRPPDMPSSVRIAK